MQYMEHYCNVSYFKEQKHTFSAPIPNKQNQMPLFWLQPSQFPT